MSDSGEVHCETSIVEMLLSPTAVTHGFKRENPTAFRFQPYSQKNRRRLDIFTPILYDLWISFEWDSTIKSFNERVDKFPVAGKDGKVFFWKPRMVSIGNQTECLVHAIEFGDEKSESEMAALDWIQAWVDVNHLMLKIWTPEEVRSNPIELENRKQLYAYICSPETLISPDLRDKVLLVLRQCRKTTLDDLIASVSDSCSEAVIQVLAEQLMLRNIFSDIQKFPFGWSTEISVFHDFT
jgi:hypothetical protein